jgi:exopolysaccharide production protein ExoZ
MIVSIQYLRAIAAIYVVVFHAAKKLGIENFFVDAGDSGVDLFFIISGFVITYTVINREYVDAKSFLLRRVIRIVPLYWILTLFYSFLLLALPALFQTYQFNIWHTLTSLFFIPQDIKPVVYTGWTLIYEMYFYLLFGLLIIFFKKDAPRYIILIFLASYTIGLFIDYSASPAIIVLTSELLLEFIIGIVFCYIYCNGVRVSKTSGLVIVLLGFLLFFVLTDNARLLAYGVPWSIVFLGIVFSPQWSIEKKSLLFLGNASYSIYLAHIFAIPAIHLLFLEHQKFSGLGNTFLLTLYTSVGVLSGVFIYLIVERPVITRLKSVMLNRMKMTSVER